MSATQNSQPHTLHIDLTPSWGQWGNVYRHFAEAGQREALRELHPDFAKAMAMASAYAAISSTLTAEQREIAARVHRTEMARAGITTPRPQPKPTSVTDCADEATPTPGM